MSSGLSFPIKAFTCRWQQAPSSGIYHDTNLTSASSLLCKSISFFNNIGSDYCYSTDSNELPFGTPLG